MTIPAGRPEQSMHLAGRFVFNRRKKQLNVLHKVSIAAALCFCAGICVLMAGCGGQSYSASGKVTLNGQPLDGAGVTFFATDPAQQSVHSTTASASGEFTIEGDENNPLTPGEYIVVVDKPAAEMGGKSVVPKNYTTKELSPLRATIAGTHSDSIEVKLTSGG